MGDTARLFEHDKTLKKKNCRLVGGGGGVGGVGDMEVGTEVCVRKRLISQKLLNQIQKMNMFWNQHELGHQPGVKKVKNSKESKLEIWDFGWNWLIFNKIWKIKKLGNEIKPKLFNPSIFVKRIKWARKWYNILSNTMCNKKVIKLNNFENSKIFRKSTLILVSTLLSHSLVWQPFKKIFIRLLEA